MTRAHVIALVALILTTLIGCHRPPVTVYEDRLDMDQLATGMSAQDNQYCLLVGQQTTGRFPCTLAIAQYAPTAGVAEALSVMDMKPADEATWSETFRGSIAVRDLRFISPRSLKATGEDRAGAIRAARLAGARLLLVHAVNRYGPNSAQVLGVLYETDTGQPLATLHTSANYVNEEGVEVAVDDESGDQRARDARYQAVKAFEHQAFACLADQVQRDTAPGTIEEHRWTPLYLYQYEQARPVRSP
ncbi:MAG: hypothetical protein ABIG44_04895 [Planctomycetota bacterium]